MDAINTLSVTCTEYDPEDSDDGTKKLPDWEWRVEGSILPLKEAYTMRLIALNDCNVLKLFQYYTFLL